MWATNGLQFSTLPTNGRNRNVRTGIRAVCDHAGLYKLARKNQTRSVADMPIQPCDHNSLYAPHPATRTMTNPTIFSMATHSALFRKYAGSQVPLTHRRNLPCSAPPLRIGAHAKCTSAPSPLRLTASSGFVRWLRKLSTVCQLSRAPASMQRPQNVALQAAHSPISAKLLPSSSSSKYGI